MANTLELERLAWPSVSLFTSFLSGLLFIIAMATPGWFRVSCNMQYSSCAHYIMLFSHQIDFEMSGQARGNMTFGIIQGREIIDGPNGELLQDATFYTCKLIKCFDHDCINFLVQLRDLAMLLILLHSIFFSCVCCSPFLYRWLTCASNLSTRIKL